MDRYNLENTFEFAIQQPLHSALLYIRLTKALPYARYFSRANLARHLAIAFPLTTLPPSRSPSRHRLPAVAGQQRHVSHRQSRWLAIRFIYC